MSITHRGETFEGLNKPKASSKGKKSHVVLIKDNGKLRMIRFGEKGASTAGNPKAGESDKMKAKGKTSAAYWADKVKW